MEVRQMAAVFLERGGKLLMMKKLGSRWHSGEFWSGIGGHLEPAELNEPREAAIREMLEETGLKETNIAAGRDACNDMERAGQSRSLLVSNRGCSNAEGNERCQPQSMVLPIL